MCVSVQQKPTWCQVDGWTLKTTNIISQDCHDFTCVSGAWQKTCNLDGALFSGGFAVIADNTILLFIKQNKCFPSEVYRCRTNLSHFQIVNII